MKTYCKDVDILSREHLERAYEAFRRSPRKKTERFEAFFARPREEVLAEAWNMVYRRRLDLEPIRTFERIEPTNGKVRVIGQESPMQQLLDYVACEALQPLLDAKVGYHQCASVKGKGQAHAVRYVKRWVRSPDCRYWAKLDVKKYYPSIDRSVLMAMLRRDVRNEPLLWLVEALISTHTHDSGLSIGSLLSQRLANYYLAGAYRHVHGLAKERRGKRVQLVGHVLTYMDDWLLTGPDKRNLKMAVRKLVKYMRDVLHLEVKGWKVSLMDAEPIDLVGFRFWRNKVTLRPAVFLRARRAYKRARQAKRPTRRQAARCVAYWGYYKASDIRGFVRRNKIKETFDLCRDVVSQHAIERKWNEENLQRVAA
ncbi:reverse transcriptase [Eggerthellaceae bacterium zg-893]|nr:reverse transcriptase [Eggerthellaceae bacterium zg-893]